MINRGSIALYGDTGSGKTTLSGELAIAVKKELGLPTHYIGIDPGGFASIAHLEGPVMEVSFPEGDPYVFLARATQGRLKEGSFGLTIFDSGTSGSDLIMSELARRSTEENIGGKVASTFSVGEGDDLRMVGGNNQSHYNLAQTELCQRIWESQRLPGLVLWTFAIRRGEGEERDEVLGPQIAGKAATTALPRFFTWTFKLGVETDAGGNATHTLYTTPHTDSMGMQRAFGNARMPLGVTAQLPTSFTPASLVEPLRIIEEAQLEAKANLAAELGV